MKFDEFLRGAAKDYKSDTIPHADEIWAAIAPEVKGAITGRRTASLRVPTWVGVGIAAALVIGVGVGRWSARSAPSTQQQVASAVPHSGADSSATAAHVRSTAIEHLADAEVFLTTVRADLKAGRTDEERSKRSRELLARTRLLLSSANTAAPEVHQLLEDLELLLAEIAATPIKRSPVDQKLLDESMRDGNLIPRIRASLPAPMAGT